MITKIETVYEWTNKEFNHSCGLYRVNMSHSDETYTFIRNGDSIGVISHYIDRSATECVDLIRTDVKKEFLEKLQVMEAQHG
jgi:hypothetical protein